MDGSLVESGRSIILHHIDSPQPGQPRLAMFVPIIQSAGHMPLPVGSLGTPFDTPIFKPELGLGFHASGSECESIG